MVLTSWLAFCARMNRWITAGSAAPPRRRRPRLSGFPLVLEHAYPTSELGQLGALLGGQLVALSSIELGLADALAKRLEGHAEIASDHAQLRPGSRASGTASTLNSGYGGLVLPPNEDSFRGRSGSSFQVSTEPGQDQGKRVTMLVNGLDVRGLNRDGLAGDRQACPRGGGGPGSPRMPRQPSTPYGTRRRAYTPMA